MIWNDLKEDKACQSNVWRWRTYVKMSTSQTSLSRIPSTTSTTLNTTPYSQSQLDSLSDSLLHNVCQEIRKEEPELLNKKDQKDLEDIWLNSDIYDAFCDAIEAFTSASSRGTKRATSRSTPQELDEWLYGNVRTIEKGELDAVSIDSYHL